MERDWVVVASSPSGEPYDLTHLNSVMRRIDLICKLIAPIFISILISLSGTKVGIVAVGSMSACSFMVEWLCARTVWYHNPKLRTLKNNTSGGNPPSLSSTNLTANSVSHRIRKGLRTYADDFVDYFSSIVWIPSMALAILHISVLAYNATMITFLVNIGFRLEIITLARAAGSIIEISSTVVTPFGIQYLARAKNHGRYVHQVMYADEAVALMEVEPEGRGTDIGVFRLGLWGLNWQLMNLVSHSRSVWFTSLHKCRYLSLCHCGGYLPTGEIL
jgi:iron-regulated transporter 1